MPHRLRHGGPLRRAAVLLIIAYALAYALLAGTRPAAAANPPEPGAGCTVAAAPEHLGEVEDRLAGRNVVVLGDVGAASPVHHYLSRGGRRTPTARFLKIRAGDTPAPLADSHLLLFNARHAHPKRTRHIPAITKALAESVPIILENFEPAHLQAITGIGFSADAVVVQSKPGGRAVTVTAIRHPNEGPNPQSIRSAVNRAIAKHDELRIQEEPPEPTRQAYAEKVWDVWLHTGNIVCQPPYDASEKASQVGNLDFGIQITLVAGTQPTQKVVNLQYIGAGLSPLAPDAVPIGVNDWFKGAFTLQLAYQGKLTAPSGAGLDGTADTVEPATAVNQHTVTKMNGFSWSLNSSCGVNKTGPMCQIGASFGFSSARQNTETIVERGIYASSSFGTNPQHDTEGDHSIAYRLSSTATADGGAAIDLTQNQWYGFFAHSTNESYCFVDGTFTRNDDACKDDPSGIFWDGRTKYPSDDNPRVRAWPVWAQNAAQTEGMAGYTMNADFTGHLTLDASILVEVGVFAFGHGPHAARVHDLRVLCGIFPCDWWSMHLYTDSFQAAQTITIDANAVNYSNMPTCAMRRFTQPDIGIWAVRNETNSPLDISKMNALPFAPTPIDTIPNDYRGTADYVIGVSATTIQPGQFEFLALCSSNQAQTGVAMYVQYDSGPGITGQISFDGAGSFVDQRDRHLAVDPVLRTITVMP
jgi:hypothetical protein